MIPRRFFWLLDTVALTAAFWAAYWLFPAIQPRLAAGFYWLARSLPFLTPLSPPFGAGLLSGWEELVWLLIVVTPPVLFVLQATGASTELIRPSHLRLGVSSLLAMTAGLGLASLVLFALRIQDWSRLFVFLFGIFGVGTLSGYRILLRSYFNWRRLAGYYSINVLLIGPASVVVRLARQIELVQRPAEYCVIGYLEVPESQPPISNLDSPTSTPPEITRLGSMADLDRLLVLHSVQNILIVIPDRGGGWVTEAVALCDEAGVPVTLLPECLWNWRPQNLRPVRSGDPMHLPAIALAPVEWDPEQVFLKRAGDVLIAGLLLAVLSPLMAFIAVAIKLTSPGPLLYHWKVIGQHGREFVGYKFRTMVENADDLKPNLLQYNEMSGPVFKMTNDPRIAPIGHFLRKYSLDELPQLYSVLKGDMSLVGPRPALRTELERYEFWHKRKLSIRPGITCLWQVRGRKASRDFAEWVRMDLEYIDNWSLWLDFKIMLWTMWAVIAGTGR